MLLLALAFLSVVGFGSVGAGTAHAVSPAVTENMDEVLGWLERGGGSTIPGVDCGNVCDDLWLAEHRPQPGLPSSEDMWDDFRKARGRVKLGWLARGFGVIGVAVTAHQVYAELGGPVPSWLGFLFPGHGGTTGDRIQSVRLVWVVGGTSIAWGCDPCMNYIVEEPGEYVVQVDTTQSGVNFRSSYQVKPHPDGHISVAPAVGSLALDNPHNGWHLRTASEADVMGWADGVRTDSLPSGGIHAGSLNPMPAPTKEELQTGFITWLDSPEGARVDTWIEHVVTRPGGPSPELSPGPTIDPYTGEGHMVEIPAPESGETYTAYMNRLAALQLVGTAIVLSESGTSPEHGPLEVVSTSPAVGTSVQQGSTVTVRYNPETAPEVGGSSNPFDPPAIPALNLQPLNQPIGDVFPFAIFPWLLGFFGGWTGSPAGCPSFSVPFTRGELLFDFCLFEPAMEIIRPVIVVVALLSMAYFFAAAALGFGGGGNDD